MTEKTNELTMASIVEINSGFRLECDGHKSRIFKDLSLLLRHFVVGVDCFKSIPTRDHPEMKSWLTVKLDPEHPLPIPQGVKGEG